MGENSRSPADPLPPQWDRLEKKGYIVRQSIPEDRRAKVIHLTSAGHTLIEEIFQQHTTAMEFAFSEVSTDDRQTLLTLLKQAGLSAQKLL